MKQHRSLFKLLRNVFIACAAILSIGVITNTVLNKSNVPTQVQAEANYLTFTAEEANSTIVFNYTSGSDVQYSTDGSAWNNYTKGDTLTLANVDDYVKFKGTNVTTDSTNHFAMTGKIAASGDVTSLTNGTGGDEALTESCYTYMFDGCSVLITAPNLPSTTLAKDCYNSIFAFCDGLTTAPTLPATTMTESCYTCMFNFCLNLTTAPALPAKTLATSCYDGMFFHCSALTSAPALPATALASHCYYNMFSGCSALTSAPALPATTLADYCYSGMFGGCTSLKSAPALPATELAAYCYDNMFYECSSLKATPTLPATTLVKKCYSYMFANCTSLVRVTKLPATTLADTCYGGMFLGCTSLKATPTLPATTLADSCYVFMFQDCTSLVSVTTLPATTMTTCCYQNMFTGCTNLKVTVTTDSTKATWNFSNITTTGASNWNYEMIKKLTAEGTLTAVASGKMYEVSAIASDNYLTFTAEEANSTIALNYSSGSDVQYTTDGTTWTSYTKGTTLTLTNVDDYVMFQGTNVTTDESNHFVMTGKIAASGDVTSLTNGTGGNATLSYACYSRMFLGCTSLTSAPALPSTTLAQYCYQCMFSGCSNLVEAPELPATDLTDCYFCYSKMFYECTKLEETPDLPATKVSNCSYQYMFYGCTSLTTTSALPATTLYSYCYEYMFSGCTSLTSAPALTATTLAEGCYRHMFEECTGLRVVEVSNASEATWIFPSTTVNYWNDDMISGLTSDETVTEVEAGKMYKVSKAIFTNYLTFTAKEAGSTIRLDYVSGSDVQYSTDGTTWTNYTKGDRLTLTNVDDYVKFRGTNVITDSSNHIYMTGQFEASGDVTSLTNGMGGDVALTEACYAYMFYSNLALTTAPNLPSTTLAKNCYDNMFASCYVLTNTPKLPATTLADYCYKYMFSYCGELTSIPELPAKNLAQHCYEAMFMCCTKLKVVETTDPSIAIWNFKDLTTADMWNRYMISGLTAKGTLTAVESGKMYTLSHTVECDVTYDANNATSGSAPTDTNLYTVGSTFTVKDNSGALVRDGYVFSGWNTNADGSGTDYTIGSSYTISEDVTLYANWKKICTITYNTTGGNELASSSGTSLPTTLPTPTREGLVFAGWYTNPGCTIEAVAGSEIYGDTTLYAKRNHVHDMGTEDTSDDIVFENELTSTYTGGDLAAGTYFLTEDITLSGSIMTVIENTSVKICLNGHKITRNGTTINVKNSGTLIIYDCSDNQGSIVSDTGNTINSYGTLEIYGGKYVSGNAYAIGVVGSNAKFIMHNGTIDSGDYMAVACSGGCEFTFFDGTIISTFIGIDADNSTVYLYGGEIKDCDYYAVNAYDGTSIVLGGDFKTTNCETGLNLSYDSDAKANNFTLTFAEGDYAPTSNMSVGISIEACVNWDYVKTTGTFIIGAKTNTYLSYLYSDSTDYKLFADKVAESNYTYSLEDKHKASFDANGGTGTIEAVSNYRNETFTLSSDGFILEGYYVASWNTKADGTGTTYAKDGTFTFGSEDVTLYAIWVEKTSVAKPSVDETEFTYTGSEQTYAITASDYYTVTGNKQTNAGTYTVTVALNDKDTCKWADGTTTDLTFTFTIDKASVDAPEQDIATFDYDGTPKTTTIETSSLYTITGTLTATNWGTYEITISLNNKDNYQWYDESTDDLTYSFTINKGTLTDETIDAEVEYDPTKDYASWNVIKDYIKITGTTEQPTLVKISFGDLLPCLDPTSEETWNDISIKDVDSYTINYAYEYANYYLVSGSFTITITKATYDLSGIKFVDTNYTYDGNEHELVIVGTLPEGVSVEYTNNKLTNAGNITATAKFTGDAANYELITDRTAVLTIDKAQIVINVDTTKITRAYDGQEATLPTASASYGDVVVSKSENVIKNVGNYLVTYTVAGDSNYKGASTTLEIEIIPCLVTKPVADTTSFVYDGTEKEYNIVTSELYTITGTTKAVTAGTYTISVALNDKENYTWADGTTTDLSYVFMISHGRLTNATQDVEVTYDPNKNYYNKNDIESYIKITGTTDTPRHIYLSFDGTNYYEDTLIDWTSAAITNANEYTIGYKVEYDNYAMVEGTYKLTITKANYDLSGITFENGTVTYDGSMHSLAITGTLPTGLSVTYTNNGQVNAGTYTIEAVFTNTNTNYNTPTKMSATLKIEKATAEIYVDTTPINVVEGTTVVLPDATSTLGEWTCDTNAASLVNPGVYTVTYEVEGTSNYNGAVKTISVTIRAKSVEKTDVTSDTDVVINNNEGIDPSENITVSVEVKIESQITESEVQDLTNDTVKLENNEKVGVVFDVKLLKDGQEIQPSDLGENTTLTIKMAIPSGVDVTKITKILHVHSADDIDVIEFDINNYDASTGTYTLTGVNKLSSFAFVYKVNTLSVGAIVGIVLGCFFGLLLLIYILGYFFCYRRGHLDDSPWKIIYKFLPRGNYGKEDNNNNTPKTKTE